MYDLVIHNGFIVSGSDILPPTTFLGVKNGIISAIACEPLEGAKIIDAKGAFVTPGGIDAHVHIEEPNLPYCDTFLNCTKAAIAGGTTTVIAFAIQNAQDTETQSSVIEEIQKYKNVAEGQCYCDYGFHLIVRNPTKLLIGKLPQVKSEGISSIKVYTTYDSLRLDDSQLLSILLENKKLGITQMIHAENHDIIKFFNEKLQEKNLLEPYFHALSRPRLAEDEASCRVISLSKIIDIPILIVHMSAKEALDHVRRAQANLIPIMAETCPQYLFLTSEKLKGGRNTRTSNKSDSHSHSSTHSDCCDFEGAKYICSPPLRDTADDLNGVWQAIQNGTVTIMSSDHAPSNFDDPKGKKLGLIDGKPDYKKVPNGLPGIETRVPLLYAHGVESERISVQKFVEITSTNPAKLYGLDGKKGSIQVGFDADLVVWHPRNEIAFNLTNEMLVHEFDYTPFEGMRFTNWPKCTILRGKVAYDHTKKEVYATPEDGEFLFRGENVLKKAIKAEVNSLLV